MADLEFTTIYKIVLVGDSGAGKSNIVGRLVDEHFDSNSRTTIGIDFRVKTFNLNGETIKIQIWDTAGQERFRSVIRSYYRLAASIIIVFDLSNRESFDSIDRWMKEIEDNTEFSIRDIVIMLIGNKSDIKKREVSKEEIDNICNKYDLIYRETSAKDCTGIDEAFQKLAVEIHKKGKHLHYTRINTDKIVLDSDIKKRGCCF